MKKLITVMFLLCACLVRAQPIDKNELAAKVGNFVQTLGPMEGSTVSDIIGRFKMQQYNV
jgi:hypothetical protein